jgi:hypothetical protein
MPLLNRRLQSKTSGRPSGQPPSVYGAIHTAWQALFLSLALDPFIALYSKPLFSLPFAFQLCIPVTLTLIPFLSQGILQGALGELRGTQKRALDKKITPLMQLALATLAILGSSKFLFAQSFEFGPALVIIVLVLFGTGKTISKLMSEMKADRERFRKNPLAQVTRWEEQLVVLSIAPIALARGVGLVGALSAHGEAAPLIALLPFLVTSSIMVAMLKPRRELFTGFCKRCKQPVPIVMVALGSCLRCDASLTGADGNTAKE